MFKMTIDPHEILGNLSDAQEKQLPYAVSLALNRIANTAQRDERDHIKETFNLRRESFVLQGIKIDKGDRASKSSWSVVIRVDVERDFLDRMESGGDKSPTKGRWLWKPNNQVFNNKIIMRSNPLHPANLQFNARLQGPNGTFMVHRRNSRDTGPLILQRVAKGASGIAQSIVRGGLRGQKGRDATGRFTAGEAVKGIRRGGIRLLYTLVSRTRVPKKLEFVSTIGDSVRGNFKQELLRALDEAMRTAK